MTAPEEWRAIPGFPGYEASSLGRILSHRRGRPRLLRPQRDERSGYLKVRVAHESGKFYTKFIHRLVAITFLAPVPEGQEVRHRVGTKTDNRVSNLEWGTHSENMFDHVAQGKHFLANKTHCPKGHPYDEDNTYSPPSRPRARYCRTCSREGTIARRAKAAAILARAA